MPILSQELLENRIEEYANLAAKYQELERQYHDQAQAALGAAQAVTDLKAELLSDPVVDLDDLKQQISQATLPATSTPWPIKAQTDETLPGVMPDSPA